jgi:hypothetical protein
MRKVATAAMLVLALGAASGCTVVVPGTPAPAPSALGEAPAPPAGPAAGTFSDAQGRFGLVPPTGWTVDTSGARGTAAAFLAPESTGTTIGAFTANINVIVLPSSGALSATVSGARHQLTALKGYREARDEPLVLSDGTPAHLLGGTFDDPASGFALRNLQLFTVDGRSTIVVTGTALAETWDVYEPVFTSSLSTLTVAS